jgi:hypothetical protein
MAQDRDEEKRRQIEIHASFSPSEEATPEQYLTIREFMQRVSRDSAATYTVKVTSAIDGEALVDEDFAQYFRDYLRAKIESKNRENKAELLDQDLQLKKHSPKYKQSDPAETWVSYWIATPIGYLIPGGRGEEWLGDMIEDNRKLMHKGYPRWMLNVVDLGKTAVLIMSAFKIKLSDFLSSEQQRSE